MHYVKTKHLISNKNGMNIYRGCLHGCIYCDSRSKVYNMNHDFEDIEIKINSLEILRKFLRNKNKKVMIGTGSMSDPYMPIERELGMIRESLELIYKYGHGFTCITKSDLILRDLDLIKKINEKTKAVVQMTLTTSDEELCKKIEPNVCTTKERVKVLRKMNKENIPTIVWLCPILPYINDNEENINKIIDYCIETNVKGIICFGMGLTLREGNREYFYRKLEQEFPRLKEKYKRRYKYKYALNSPNNKELMELFHKRTDEHNIMNNPDDIFKYLHELPQKERFKQSTLI